MMEKTVVQGCVYDFKSSPDNSCRANCNHNRDR